VREGKVGSDEEIVFNREQHRNIRSGKLDLPRLDKNQAIDYGRSEDRSFAAASGAHRSSAAWFCGSGPHFAHDKLAHLPWVPLLPGDAARRAGPFPP